MKFWDASALVPLIVHEDRSSSSEHTLRDDPIIVAWWGSTVELASAISRREREGMTRADANLGRTRCRELAAAWFEITPTEAVRSLAQRLLLRHPLRAADSLQLAAALVWSRGSPEQSDFVCADKRLCGAAHAEGFHVLEL